MGNQQARYESVQPYGPVRSKMVPRSHQKQQSTKPDKTYLQPTNKILDDYLTRQMGLLKAGDHGLGRPLRPLNYREAYAHLCELAEKQDERVEDSCESTSSLHRPVSGVYAGNSNHGNKKATDEYPTLCGEKERSKVNQPGCPTVDLAHGLGDHPSFQSRASSASSSNTYDCPVAKPNKTPSPDTRRSTPYDWVANLGASSSGSLDCTDSEDARFQGDPPSNTTRNALNDTASDTQGIHAKNNRFAYGAQSSIVSRRSTPGNVAVKTYFAQTDGPRLRSTGSSVSQNPSPTVGGLAAQLGFHTHPDGSVTYTVFIFSGPCGVPVEGWLSDLQKRASRHLTGLRRQYGCTVQFDQRLMAYRGLFVHPVVLSGPNRSAVIRYRNALPACIDRYLITPYAHHGTTTLRRAR